jgi:hypothetical protein
MESAVQLALPLFEHPSFEDVLRRRNLSGALSVVVNPRLTRGWRVRVKPLWGGRQLTIPGYLESAPAEVKNALVDWALLPCRPRKNQKGAARRQRSILEKTVWEYVYALPNAPKQRSRFNPASFSAGARGQKYDLREVFDSVNKRYFNGTLAALLRWGGPRSKMSYHMAKTAPDGQKFNLITIAGAYDHHDVPRFAIEAIMYHEMLHIAVPPYIRQGRKVVHGQEFKKAEREFKDFEAWRRWERCELPLIIRKKRRLK